MVDIGNQDQTNFFLNLYYIQGQPLLLHNLFQICFVPQPQLC